MLVFIIYRTSLIGLHGNKTFLIELHSNKKHRRIDNGFIFNNSFIFNNIKWNSGDQLTAIISDINCCVYSG